MSKNSQSLQWFIRLGSFFLVVAALYLARDVFVPLALSFLFSFVLNPIVLWMQRSGVGRIPAVVVTVGLALTLVGAILYNIASEMASLVNELPRYKTELVSKVRGVSGVGSQFGASLDTMRKEMSKAFTKVENASEETAASENPAKASTVEQKLREQTNDEFAQETSLSDGKSPDTPLFVTDVQRSSISIFGWAESAGVVLGPLGTAGLVLVFTLFIMIYQADLRDRLIKVVSGGQYVTTTSTMNEAAERITRYLVAQAIVNISYGVVMAFGLWLIGVGLGGDKGFPNFLLWGFLCAVLRFVPYLGPVVAGFFPIAVSVAVFPGFTVFASVVALITLVELLCNNVLEPWLYGASTGISTLAVIFAAVFWGWLWGPVGLLLATPLTVCLVVLGKHVEQFKIFKTLLGEGEPMRPSMRFYQRLLARDEHHAAQLAQLQIDTDGHISFFDSTLIPAMRKMRYDREANRLERTDENEMREIIQRVLSKILNKAETQPTTDKEVVEEISSAPVRVIAIPSHNDFEELILSRCFQDIVRPGIEYRVESTKGLPSDLENGIAAQKPDIILLGLLPPGGMLQTEYLCEQIKKRSPDSKVIVAYFGRTRSFDKLLIRLRKSGASYVATSVEQSLAYIENTLPIKSLLATSDARQTVAEVGSK